MSNDGSRTQFECGKRWLAVQANRELGRGDARARIAVLKDCHVHAVADVVLGLNQGGARIDCEEIVGLCRVLATEIAVEGKTNSRTSNYDVGRKVDQSPSTNWSLWAAKYGAADVFYQVAPHDMVLNIDETSAVLPVVGACVGAESLYGEGLNQDVAPRSRFYDPRSHGDVVVVGVVGSVASTAEDGAEGDIQSFAGICVDVCVVRVTIFSRIAAVVVQELRHHEEDQHARSFCGIKPLLC
jgi:hypothetical protein